MAQDHESEQGATVVFNAQAGLLLYEPYPSDPEQSELWLRDLRSTRASIICLGSFINSTQFQIVSDETSVAYGRPCVPLPPKCCCTTVPTAGRKS